jgi:hypothetical protein
LRRALLALGLGLAALPASGQIERRVDRQVWSIHVDVADQLDEAGLRLSLEEASRLLAADQGEDDAACCMQLEAIELEIFGTPGDGLDVIDNEMEFSALLGRKALVQSINWCSVPGAGIVGCAQTPGNTLAVALDAPVGFLPVSLAHERGHNAGLQHRGDVSCALMQASLQQSHGCLRVSECLAYRGIDGVLTEGACSCHASSIGEPIFEDGTSCDADGVPGTCHSEGLCAALPSNDLCEDATPVTGDIALLGDNDVAQTQSGATCSPSSNDVWYAYTPDCSGMLHLDLCDTALDSVLSAAADCAADPLAELACNDDCPRSVIPDCPRRASCLDVSAVYQQELRIRVGGVGRTGAFVLRAECEEDPLLDTDGDGLADAQEYRLLGTDPSVSDTDGDGWSDGEEVLQFGSNPLLSDTDGDAVLDASDNCPLRFNDQLDSGRVASPTNPLGAGADGIGDACQCGDLDATGNVDVLDAVRLRVQLLGAGSLDASRCGVYAAATACDLVQSVVLRRGIAGESPGVAQVCAAAVAGS